jgi:hypothetical protein
MAILDVHRRALLLVRKYGFGASIEAAQMIGDEVRDGRREEANRLLALLREVNNLLGLRAGRKPR